MNLFLQIILAAIAANVIATPVNNRQHPSPSPSPSPSPPRDHPVLPPLVQPLPPPPHLNHPNDQNLVLPPFRNLVQPPPPPRLPPLDQLQRDQQHAAALSQQHLTAARAHGYLAATHVVAGDVARRAARFGGANAAERQRLQNLAHIHDQRRIIAQTNQRLHTTAARDLPPDWNIERTRRSQIGALNAIKMLFQQHGANIARLRQEHRIAAANHDSSASAYAMAGDTARRAAQGANAADSHTLENLANELEQRRITAENNQRWHTTAAQQQLPPDWNVERIRGSQSSGVQDLARAMIAARHLMRGRRQEILGTGGPNNWQHTVESIYRDDQAHRMAHQPNRV